ncbi:NACHT domain-containing protein [Duganella sp. FT134W]|uniref:NACHT domain-containing protein n=1 Tax=Duganella margarita TaxID=2692170 RepID=A0A7X4GZF9_9BURK|nr:NACHT domain-containing protein [Duganella margarita]MYM72005.1 NACHT domain-containing protein [Duganella margarita]
MFDIDGVQSIANTANPLRTADVVFVHGLDGSSHSTWRYLTPDHREHFFWPAALAEDCPHYGVWTLGYAAGIHTFAPSAMAIKERARNLAHRLLNAGLGAYPIIFVTHSMGGLVVKSLLVTSELEADSDSKAIARVTKGIVFCATPHQGSAFATAAWLLGKHFGGIQPHLAQLQANNEKLNILHDHFVNWHRSHQVPLLSYAESLSLTQRTVFSRIPLALVVPLDSADPRIKGYPPFPVDEDHITIAKPRHRNSDVYAGVLRFLRSLELAAPASIGGSPPPDDPALPPELPRGGMHEQLPWFLRNRVAEFYTLYCGTGLTSAPFGGRSQYTDALVAWATDTGRSARCLVTGPAGRGKSALMIHVAAALDAQNQPGDQDGWQVFLVPISMRCETHSSDIYLQILATGLAYLAGIPLPASTQEPAQMQARLYYESACLAAIDRIIKYGRKVLVIVDGIDESLGGRFSSSWFPSQTNGRVKLLLSARAQLGQEDPQRWLAELGWQRDAEQLALPVLEEDDIVDVLRNAGAAAADLVPGQPLVARLLNLTGGEPFLLDMYIRDLWPQEGHGVPVSLAQLDAFQPGVAGYFTSWIKQQKDAWELERRQGAELDYQSIRAHLAVLACAKGRLPANELFSVVACAHGMTSEFDIESPLWPIRRFVLGVDRAQRSVAESYILSHPKLTEFFLGYFPKEIIDKTRLAFVELGGELVAALNRGQQRPEEASPYYIEYYVHHLQDAGVAADRYDILLSRGWRDAHAALGGNLVGFIRDARIAAGALMTQAPAAWRSRLLGQQLFVSSARTATVLPGRLMMNGIKHGLVRPDAALRMLELAGDDAKWFGLLQLLPHLTEEQQLPVINDALLCAQRLEPGSERAVALASLLPMIPIEQHQAAREDMFSQFGHTGNMARFLMTVEQVTPLLAGRDRERLWWYLLDSINEQGQWVYLLRVLPHLSRQEQQTCIAAAAYRNLSLLGRHYGEAVAEHEPIPGLGGTLLLVAFRFLPADLQEMLRSAAIQIIEDSDDAYLRAIGLIGIIAAYGPSTYEQYKEEVLEAIESQYYAYEQIVLTSELSKVLVGAHRDQVVASALTKVSNYIQTESLSRFEHIAGILNDAERDLALAAVATAPYRSAKAAALDELAPYLTREQTSAALTMLEHIGDEDICDLALAALDGESPENQPQSLTLHESEEMTKWLTYPHLDSYFESLFSRLSQLPQHLMLPAYEKLARDAERADRTVLIHYISTCVRTIREIDGDEGVQALRASIVAVRSTFP